jgi:translation elongation factor EF-1beta
MGMFNAELFRNLAIGFGLGALTIAVVVATQTVLGF